MTPLELDLGYTVKYNPVPSGVSLCKGLYLTVYFLSCPYTDTVLGQCVQYSVPSQCVQCSVPGQCVQCSVPGQCVQCSLPGQCVQCLVPGQCVQYSAPGQCVQYSVPGQCVQCAVPGQCILVSTLDHVPYKAISRWNTGPHHHLKFFKVHTTPPPTVMYSKQDNITTFPALQYMWPHYQLQ